MDTYIVLNKHGRRVVGHDHLSYGEAKRFIVEYIRRWCPEAHPGEFRIIRNERNFYLGT